jgi:hypothetical protein
MRTLFFTQKRLFFQILFCHEKAMIPAMKLCVFQNSYSLAPWNETNHTHNTFGARKKKSHNITLTSKSVSNQANKQASK